MRILIAGMGDLGAAVASTAVDEGHEVFGLRRSSVAAPPGVALLQADVTDPGSLALPPAVDVAIYCVAAGARDEGAYRQAYPVGLGNVLNALERGGSSDARVLFVSSTGVYGDETGAWVDEDTPPRPERFTGRAMLDAEAVLRGSPLEGTSLRLGGIYGPGRTYLLEALRAGRPFPEESMEQWTNRIHRDDAARALLHLANHPTQAPALNVVDPHPARRREVLAWLADRLGTSVATSSEAASRRSGGDRRVSCQRLCSTGFEHRYPSFKEGYGPLLSGPQ